jgi:hypothetical protein
VSQDDCIQAECDPAVYPNLPVGMYQGGIDHSKVDDDRSEIDDDRSNIANFKFRANEYVVTVEKTNNYEGNIISYVDLRTKGTDDIERYKVTMKLQNNTLSIVSMESSPQ